SNTFNAVPAAVSNNLLGGVNDYAGTDGSGIGHIGGSAALSQALQPFAGQLAMVRIYDRALTPAELAANYEAVRQPVLFVVPSSPVMTTLGATVTLNADGSIDYDATALSTNLDHGAIAYDSFTYTISDGAGGFASAAVTVQVVGVGNLIAVDDAFPVDEDLPTDLPVLTNDINALGVEILVARVVANYRNDYQTGTVGGEPADFTNAFGHGWRYLWNAPTDWHTGSFDAGTGPLGSVNDYDLLVWDPALNIWAPNNSGVRNDGPPGNWIAFNPNGGHPGPSASEDEGVTNTLARYVIAAYTVDREGYYAIDDSFVTKPSTANNGISVVILTNNTALSTTLVAPGQTTDFDGELGFMLAGQTIYVGLGPYIDQGNDSFTWDYSIVRLPGPGTLDHISITGLVSVTNGTTITYDPNGQFDALAAGQSVFETFAYGITNGSERSTALVTVQVFGSNDPPVAVSDTNRTDAASNVAGVTLTNDTDIDVGDILSVADVQGAASNVGVAVATDNGGEVTLMNDGSYIYSPNGAFDDLGLGEIAIDTFTYLPEDQLGLDALNVATVTVTCRSLTT
ncbi:MAG: Ig-like domain-containing protein, partial [Verrucomicrobiota bacterium]